MRRTALIAVLLAGTLAGTAMAAGPDGGMFHRGGGMHQKMMRQGERFEHIEGRLAFLKTELKITGNQETAWNSFATVLRQQNESAKSAYEKRKGEMRGRFEQKDGARDAMQERPVTPLPERFTKMETRLQARLDHLETLKGATLKFYGVLNAEQKKTADEILFSRHGMM